MDTQTDPRIEKLIRCLMQAGTPLNEATAIATSIEHSVASYSYAAQYGTLAVDALNTFLNRIPE
jgi:hypothetical protein